jgi:hypothetical protein
MKVLQHTSERLTIQERLIGIWVLSLGSIGAGLFMFFLFEPPVDWVGAFCIGLGCIFRTLAPTETLIFDKLTGFLTVHQSRYLSRRTTRLPMADIGAVNVESLKVGGFRFYQISLEPSPGRKLAVTRTFSTDLQQQRQIVRHICDFLGKTHNPHDEILQPMAPN